MTKATVSELKANLSHYLREVRRGGEVQILDRGKPTARLVPADATGDGGERDRLVSQGVLRPGNGDSAAVLEDPPLLLPTSILDALVEDREDRL